MARYKAVVESAAALAADTAFANIVPAAASTFRLRRLLINIKAGAGVPTSQQWAVGITRSTARGTQTATTTFSKMDPRSPASAITGIDTAWSVAPTFTATPAAALAEPGANTQSYVDLPWEQLEELYGDVGTANGVLLYNVNDALPTGHFYVVTFEIEE